MRQPKAIGAIWGALVCTIHAQTDLRLNIEMRQDDSTVELTFPSELGKTYRIEKSSDFDQFTSIEPINGTGDLITFRISVNEDHQFFRVIEEVFELPLYPSGLVLKAIPGGSFVMGNDDAKGPISDDFKPERTVVITAFEMSEAEVTNAQYVEFLNSAMAEGRITVGTGMSMGQVATYVLGADGQIYEGRKFIELSGSRVLKDHDGDGTIDPENPLNQCWIQYDEGQNTFSVKDPRAIDWDAFPYEPGEARSEWDDLSDDNLPSLEDVEQWPVTFIKWYGAWAFANFYDLDLPTEAEWEYASKGGMNHTYPSADGYMDATRANYNEDNLHPDKGHVVAVKSYDPNPLGLYDLGGNVWEWCGDWYDPDFYAKSPDPDSDPFNGQLILGETEPVEGPDFSGGPGQDYNGDTKVKRGGSWNFHLATLESSARERDYTWRGNDHFGFRVVRRP